MSVDSKRGVEEFWNKIYLDNENKNYACRIEMPDQDDPVLNRALKHFGDINGKTLIDLGCGSGATSLFFASKGANVISIDISDVAIGKLTDYCIEHEIENILPRKLSAQEISSVGQVDYVFGSMILHHIEPFDEFAKELRRTIAEGGKAFFWENNARSRLMIWFRQNIVGRLWVPKYGDDDEFPLTVDEVDQLRRYFSVNCEYPELVFFRLISAYLLRDRFGQPFEILDSYFYKFASLRKYSYWQYICLS